MSTVGLDTDVVIKCCAYLLLRDVILWAQKGGDETAILGAARYTALSRLSKLPLHKGPDAALAHLDQELARLVILEPSDEETKLAANLERTAQALSLPLDTGESQLAAIALLREFRLLATGDKRAIRALAILSGSYAAVAGLRRKIICLEQLLIAVSGGGGALPAIKERVCGEPEMDRALSTIFQCVSGGNNPSDWAEGLASYIRSLRAEPGELLTTDF